MNATVVGQELDLQAEVGQWVARRPATARVFEEFGIDYCCGGKRPLAAVCQEKGIDPELVLRRLDALVASPAEISDENWLEAPLSDLCDHIEVTHHAYLKTELPRLTAMVAKVVRVHGESHPELAKVAEAFDCLREELEPHMFKEEKILFPAIRWLEKSSGPAAFPFGTIANPIRMMESEHDNAGDALGRIRQLTRDFEVPEGACNTYRAMLDGLHTLEQDMHRHVHKENCILFPRAIAREQGLASA